MSLNRRALLRGGAAAAAALPVLAACGETEVVTKEVVKEVPVEKIVTREVIKEVEVERVVTVTVPEPPSESQPLIIYSGRSESLVDPIIQQFRALSGLDVQVKYAGTPALAATLLEEGDASPADVFFAQDPGGLGAVESLLSPLPEELVTRVPAWARSPAGPVDRHFGTRPGRRVQHRPPQPGRPARRPVGLHRSELARPPGLAADQRVVPDHGHRHAVRVG